MKTDYSDIKFKNNGKLKLLIIVGTRPEIIRLAAVIDKCREYFDCILAHTGQTTIIILTVCSLRTWSYLTPRCIWTQSEPISVRQSAIS